MWVTSCIMAFNAGRAEGMEIERGMAHERLKVAVKGAFDSGFAQGLNEGRARKRDAKGHFIRENQG